MLDHLELLLGKGLGFGATRMAKPSRLQQPGGSEARATPPVFPTPMTILQGSQPRQVKENTPPHSVCCDPFSKDRIAPILFRGYRALRAQPPAAVAVMALPSSDGRAALVPVANANGLRGKQGIAGAGFEPATPSFPTSIYNEGITTSVTAWLVPSGLVPLVTTQRN